MRKSSEACFEREKMTKKNGTGRGVKSEKTGGVRFKLKKTERRYTGAVQEEQEHRAFHGLSLAAPVVPLLTNATTSEGG